MNRQVLSIFFDPPAGDGIPMAAILIVVSILLQSLLYWFFCFGGRESLERHKMEGKRFILAEQLEYDRVTRARRLAKRDRLRALLAERSSDESE